MNDWLPIAMAIGGYLLGSVPFGIVVSRCLATVDPRTAGSHNIGFTNVLRVGGKTAGFLTLAGDFGKGWIVAWAARQSIESETWVLLVAISCVIGHVCSIFLGFRGGKGVATAIGAVTGVAPRIGLVTLLIWLIAAGVWRYSSGAAVTAFIALPLLSAGLGAGWRFQIFTFLVGMLILFRHKENVVRLWNGQEPKIGSRPMTT